MAQDVLYVGTHGPEDPTRATLVFAAALAMQTQKTEPGTTVKVALLGEGVLLLIPGVAAGIKVVGTRPTYPTLDLLIDAAVKAGVEIHC